MGYMVYPRRVRTSSRWVEDPSCLVGSDMEAMRAPNVRDAVSWFSRNQYLQQFNKEKEQQRGKE